MGDILEKLGFQRHCDEVLIMDEQENNLRSISLWVLPFWRLKHMVDDKIHSRSNGPDVILTRQPVEGRSRDGGLRFGEMERDCILSHGASQFLKETLQDRSDNYRMYTCKKCGLVSSVNKKAKINYCKNCDNSTSFSEVRVPYAMKLFIQELETMCVAPRLNTKKY